jgi:cytochrome P450
MSASLNCPAGSIADAPPAGRFDLRTPPPGFYEDPFPLYRDLRRHDPVHRLPDGGLFITRHADVLAVDRDHRRFSAAPPPGSAAALGDGELANHYRAAVVFTDPPVHARLRRALAEALTPRAVAAMEPGLVRLVDGLLDRLQPRGAFDAAADFAALLPVEVVGNLLGVPAAHRLPLRGWSLAILGALEPGCAEADRRGAEQALAEFGGYLRELIADRRARPGDPDQDALTRLISDTAGGEPLSETELLHNCVFLLNAGHETSANLIANALHALARHPAERDRLLAEPALIGGATEEFLRYDCPVQLELRTCTEATTIGVAVPVAAGTTVILCIGAANRDPDVFADPDRLDVVRAPNPHLGFGAGIHTCLGSAVARLEARVAIAGFLHRFPRYELAAPPRRAAQARFRGFQSLPVRVP